MYLEFAILQDAAMQGMQSWERAALGLSREFDPNNPLWTYMRGYTIMSAMTSPNRETWFSERDGASVDVKIG